MPASTELDPRVVRTRRNVLAAARTVLVEEGWQRVTVTRVADRSGYSRTTLYRHWPQRLDLLRDLITEEVQLLHTVPTGDVRADLVAELEAFRVAITTTGLGKVMIAIGQQASDDAELAELSSAVRADGTRVLDEIITAAVSRGELCDQLDPDMAVAQLIGPVLFRYLFESHGGLDGASVVSVVDLFLRGASSPTDR
ncbi:MAG: TetR/AcrR family transcriptional regulator [Actinomycetota bacterium]|nr:TetR/AcrR family transcriptional regulator [Actinomycetota bacterium]